MYKFSILKEVNAKEWDNNLKKSNYATFFQSAKFLTIQSQGNYPLFLYVLDDDDNIQGQLGLTIRKSYTSYSTQKLKRFTKIISNLGARGTWVAGPIIHSKDKKIRIKILQTFLNALEVIAKKNNLMLVDGYSSPQDLLIDRKYKQEFERMGYKTEKFGTYVSDLNMPLEEIWKKVAKKARNDVTRAKRREITVKKLEKFDDFIKFQSLIKKWGKTKGIEVSGQSKLIENDWQLYKNGIQHFFFAYQDNEIVSGLRVGCFNGIAYTHQVLSTYSKVTSLGGSLLTWHAIEWAKKNGLQIYDFSGIKSPSKNENKLKYNQQWLGLKEYKKKWGGNEFLYYHFVKTQKGSVYKLFRLLSRLDFTYREYKKKHFHRSIKTTSLDRFSK